MARYFYVCENCGANLDPGEKCCCKKGLDAETKEWEHSEAKKKEEARSDDSDFFSET